MIIFLGALQWVEPSPSVRHILKMCDRTCSSLGQGPIFWECPLYPKASPYIKSYLKSQHEHSYRSQLLKLHMSLQVGMKFLTFYIEKNTCIFPKKIQNNAKN
jgi:hypothetical protein